MKEFWTLFKYEFKIQTPFLRKKAKKSDNIQKVYFFLRICKKSSIFAR